MFPVKGNAGANDLHVERAVVPKRLAWTKGNRVPFFKKYFLIENKVLKVRVRRELESQRPDNLFEEIA